MIYISPSPELSLVRVPFRPYTGPVNQQSHFDLNTIEVRTMYQAGKADHYPRAVGLSLGKDNNKVTFRPSRKAVLKYTGSNFRRYVAAFLLNIQFYMTSKLSVKTLCQNLFFPFLLLERWFITTLLDK